MPVLASEVPYIGRCDFCNVDHPTWRVPASSFQVAPGHGSDGDWAACDSCVELVKVRNWSVLARRAAPAPHLVPALQVLYGTLEQHLLGEPVPL